MSAGLDCHDRREGCPLEAFSESAAACEEIHRSHALVNDGKVADLAYCNRAGATRLAIER